MQSLTEHATAGRHLSGEQVEAAVGFLLSPAVEDAAKGRFPRGSPRQGRDRGRDRRLRPLPPPPRSRSRASAPRNCKAPSSMSAAPAGDKMDFFNVSTTAMFVLAAGGAVVVKHGNRGITSRCGGADVLEELGISIELPPAALRESIKRTGIGFLFAPELSPLFQDHRPRPQGPRRARRRHHLQSSRPPPESRAAAAPVGWRLLPHPSSRLRRSLRPSSRASASSWSTVNRASTKFPPSASPTPRAWRGKRSVSLR